jgi:hypothetical protein
MRKSGSNNGRAFTVLRDVSLHSPILSIKINPKIDVIAVATKDGALSLHRIDWQRLWRTVSPGNECTCLTWREDGKILAVGRRNGDVELFHVENGNNHAGGEGAVYPSWTVERMTERFCDGLGEEEDGKRKISALCWTGVVGSIAEDKETGHAVDERVRSVGEEWKPRDVGRPGVTTPPRCFSTTTRRRANFTLGQS